MGKKSKRPRPLQRQVGSVVEDAILVAGGPGFSTLAVSDHFKLDEGDAEYRAKASLGERTRTVSVGDMSVTQIKPREPYTACRYGNIVSRGKGLGRRRVLLGRLGRRPGQCRPAGGAHAMPGRLEATAVG